MSCPPCLLVIADITIPVNSSSDYDAYLRTMAMFAPNMMVIYQIGHLAAALENGIFAPISAAIESEILIVLA